MSVLGSYGYGNFGDDVVMLEGLKRLFKGWELCVMSLTPNSSFPVFNYETVNSSDLFVVGGGEIIYGNRLVFYSPLVRYTQFPAFVHRMFLAYDWVKKIHVPKAVLGCGLNALSSRYLSPLVLRELEQFDYVGLRDSASVGILKTYPFLREKVSLFYDLAFAVETEGLTYSNREDYAVVVPTDRPLVYAVDSSKGWLEKHLRSYGKSVFVPFCQFDNDDYKTCKALSNCVKESVVLEPGALTLERMLYLVGNSRGVFAYRLHGLALAFLLGVPCEFWPYHFKVSRMAETLQGKNVDDVRSWQKVEFQNFMSEHF